MRKKKKFVQNEYNTRIPCICQRRTCYIIYREHCIGTLTEEKNDAGEFDWVITMDWEEWELTGEPSMPGINTDLRLKEYIRTFVPVIVEQRVPPPSRLDAKMYMASKHMTYFDAFQFMVDNHGECGNNMLLIGATPTDYIKGYWDKLEQSIAEYRKEHPEDKRFKDLKGVDK